ncbi:hypothetical protein D5086_015690 [Populus alba]|uniref:Uncharacterized protein n=1 Tax=Populus alba TaxID=43335 RepID=A0ACC4BTX8_POPAL
MPPEVSSSSQVIVNKTFEVPSIVDAKSLMECQLATVAFSFKPRFPHSTCGLHNLENFARNGYDSTTLARHGPPVIIVMSVEDAHFMGPWYYSD